MSNKKMLIVVGAGASQEVKLPVGSELKKIIATLLDFRFVASGKPDLRKANRGDYIIFKALREHVRQPNGEPGEMNPYIQAAWTIRDAMPQAISIDNFIDAHNDNKKIELCGKLAIVRAILQAERNSLLYVDLERYAAQLQYPQLSETWFTSFMQLLTENCRITDLADRLRYVSLIVFNYDRCIEHFLYHSLQNYYKIDETTAANIVNSIEIYHPYGTIGHLPWQEQEGSVQFGAEPKADQLLSLAAQIKTFAEGTDTTYSKISTIHKKVVEARILVFLGFAFHQLNLGLLTPKLGEFPIKNRESYNCFGTAQGISQSNCNIIVEELAEMRGPFTDMLPALRSDLRCSELLPEYWRSLSLS